MSYKIGGCNLEALTFNIFHVSFHSFFIQAKYFANAQFIVLKIY